MRRSPLKGRSAAVLVSAATAIAAALVFAATALAAVTPGAPTTTHNISPSLAGQGDVPDCPLGSFSLKAAVEHASSKSYTEGGVTVTVTSASPDDLFFDFTATGGTVSVVYVKTKPFITAFDYQLASGGPGPVTSDTDLHGPQEDGTYQEVEHITFCVSALLPTAVAFRSFTATSSAKGTLLRWRTGSEVGVLGFNVYRERAGVRVRVNRSLIRARGATHGAAYSWLHRRAQPYRARYWLQAIQSDGSRTWQGPIRALAAR